MTSLSIAGCGVVSPAGLGADALAAAVGRGEPAVAASPASEDLLPATPVHRYAGFDVKALLGRKGTIFLDRVTALALVAADAAIESGELSVDDSNRDGIGVVLGTTVGSLKSTMDYSADTLTQDRPYLVNPALFPNSVMNCAASQIAIRRGLKGMNATIAGGPVAVVQALRYTANALRRGYADVVIAGAAEEFTPNTAWAAALRHQGRAVGAGEGAAMFVLRRAGDHDRVRMLAISTGFGADDPAAALAGCVLRALDDAGAAPADVTVAASGSPDDTVDTAALAVALPRSDFERVDMTATVGDAQAAIGALQLANLVFAYTTGRMRAGELSLLTACTPEGDVGAVLVGEGDGADPGRG